MIQLIKLWYQLIINQVRRSTNYRRGSPLVEESILLGLSLFAFMILATIIFDLIEFAKNIFADVSDGLDQFPQ